MEQFLDGYQDAQTALEVDLNMTTKLENTHVLDIEMIKILKTAIAHSQNKRLREIHGKHDVNNLYFVTFKQNRYFILKLEFKNKIILFTNKKNECY